MTYRSSAANIGDMQNIYLAQSWVLTTHGAYLRRKSLEPLSPLVLAVQRIVAGPFQCGPKGPFRRYYDTLLGHIHICW